MRGLNLGDGVKVVQLLLSLTPFIANPTFFKKVLQNVELPMFLRDLDSVNSNKKNVIFGFQVKFKFDVLYSLKERHNFVVSTSVNEESTRSNEGGNKLTTSKNNRKNLPISSHSLTIRLI